MAVTKIQPTGVNSEASFTFANVTATGNVSTGNLSVTGNLALTGAEINLGNVSNVKITGGTANYVLKTDGTGNLSWTAQTGGGGGSTINVSESNGTGGNITNAISSISTLRFNKDTGIYVSDLGGGNALVSLGSTFKTWKVTGQTDLVAVGEDTIQFIEGSGITITTSNTSNPKNITFTSNNVANSNYANYAGNAFSVTGSNVVGEVAYAATANSVAGGNVSGQVSNALIAGTVYTNAQPNITSVGTLSTLSVSGTVNGGNFVIQGAGNFSGNGSRITYINGANVVGEVDYAAVANSVAGSNVSGTVSSASSATTATTAGTVTANAQPNITSTGTLASLSVNGNVTAGNIKTDNLLYANGTAWSMGGGGGTPGGTNTQIQFNDGSSFGGNANLTFDKATSILTITGNVIASNANLGNLATANYFSGSGNLLSNIQGSNVTGAVAYATTANSVSGSNVSGEVSYAATANSVAGGNVTGAVAYATTANSVAGGNVSGQVSNALIAGTVYTNAQPNITSVGTLASLSVSGNANIGNIALTGTIVAGTGSGGNISGVDYATANFFVGNGSLLSSITGANVTGEVSYAATANSVAGSNVSGQVSNALVSGTVYTNAQPNITSVGTLTSLSVSGNALVTGNLIVDGTTTYVNTTNIIVQDPIIEQGGGANGTALTTNDGKDRGIVLHYYSGSTKDAFMGWDNSNAEFSFGSNVSMSGEVATFNTLGNIRAGNANLGNLVTASFFSGSGNLLSNIQGANVSGEVAYAATANSVAGGNVSGAVASATSATTAATVTTNAQPNITSVGTLTGLTVSSSIIISGASGYLKANSLQDIATGTQTIYLGYGSTGGAVGINKDLTVGTTAGNINVPSGYISASGDITGSNISATANVVAGNVKTDNLLYANGTAWSLGGGSYGNSNVATYLAAFGSNTISTTGTITSGNLLAGTGFISTTGNANVGNVFVASTGVVSTAGNITGGNLLFGTGIVSGTGLITAANLSATANVIAGNVKTDNLLYANGTVWTMGGSYDNSNVATYLAAFGSNTISTTGTISSGNLVVNSGNFITSPATTNANITIDPDGTGNFVVTAATPAVFGNTLSVTSTITAGNLAFGSGFVSGTGLVTAGNLSATANVIAGNVKTDNLLYANGTAWSLGGGSYGNSNVATFLASGFGSNTISTTSNISAGNIKTDNLLYANGTAWSLGGGSYSNTNVTNYLPTHTGNVGAPGSTGYLNGNGFYLTGLTGVSGATISNGTSNVNIAAAAGNVTVGVGGTAAVATFSTTGMVVGAGNLTVGTGTGGNLTGIVYSSSNASVTIGQSLGTVSGTVAVNIALGSYIQATTGGSTTWSFLNPPASGNAVGVVLELTNGGTAAQIWTNVRWPAGTAPTLTSSGVDVLVFITDDGGSNWRGLASMIDSK